MTEHALSPVPDLLLQLSFHQADTALVLLDPRGRIRELNAVARRLLGDTGEPLGKELAARWPAAQCDLLGCLEGFRLVRLQPPPAAAPPSQPVPASPEKDCGRLLAALERSPDLVWLFTPEGITLYLNPTARRTFRLGPQDSPTQINFSACYPPWALARIRHVGIPAAVRDGSWAGETALLLPDGQELPVSQVLVAHHDLAGRLEYFSSVLRDLCECRRTEQAVHEAERLEELGGLAAGVAHKFNNLLTGILGFAGLTRDEPETGPAARAYLDQIEDSARQAAEVCRRMLAFAGLGQRKLAPLDLSETVRDLASVLDVTVPPNVSLRLQLHKPLPPILADSNQLGQALVYLVTNAAEAQPATGGSVRIRTCLERLDPDRLRALRVGSDLPPGRYAVVEVEDTGSGMDAVTLGRIFEPFFTTRFHGRGLGLPAVLGIVRSHQGGISVETQPGKGTTVRLYFPCDLGADGPPKHSAEPERRLTGTVLVVDDEDGARRFLTSMLQVYGLRVLSARDGWQALDLLENHRGEIRLVLLDLVMPRMSGERVLDEIRLRWPDVPVVVMSAFSESEVCRRLAGKPVAGFLHKPFSGEELYRLTVSLLAAGPHPS